MRKEMRRGGAVHERARARACVRACMCWLGPRGGGEMGAGGLPADLLRQIVVASG